MKCDMPTSLKGIFWLALQNPDLSATRKSSCHFLFAPHPEYPEAGPGRPNGAPASLLHTAETYHTIPRTSWAWHGRHSKGFTTIGRDMLRGLHEPPSKRPLPYPCAFQQQRRRQTIHGLDVIPHFKHALTREDILTHGRASLALDLAATDHEDLALEVCSPTARTFNGWQLPPRHDTQCKRRGCRKRSLHKATANVTGVLRACTQLDGRAQRA